MPIFIHSWLHQKATLFVVDLSETWTPKYLPRHLNKSVLVLRERGKKIMTMKNIRKLHLYGVLMSTYAKHLDSVVRALTLLTLKHSGNYVLIWWFWVIIAHNPSLSVWLVKIITKFLDFTLLGMSIFPTSKTNGIFWRIDNPLEVYSVDRYLCPLINSIVIAK